MSLPDCFAVMNHVEQVLVSAEGAAEAHRLVEVGASTGEFVDAFARFADPQHAATLREEISQLPENTIKMIISAWLLAESAGKPLTLKSVLPPRPLEAARTRRVELSVVMEEGGVTVALSHIPGRHASWYRPAAAVA